ncbi:MAG: class I SAM-dependent methyltransferase [Pirellulales bacterium]
MNVQQDDAITADQSKRGQSPFDESYYREVYRDYDRQNPPAKLRHYAAQVKALKQPPVAERRIHDIGCAFGRFLGELGSGWRRYGSDVSGYAIGRARKEQPECTFAVAEMGQAEREGFPRQFHAVTAFDSIEHMPDPEQLAANVRGQLPPGGLFVFVVPVYDGLSGPLIRQLDRDPTHLHKWPRQRWLDWAGRHFEIVHWHGILRYLMPWGQYLHWPTKCFRWHTPAILVVATKKSKE